MRSARLQGGTVCLLCLLLVLKPRRWTIMSQSSPHSADRSKGSTPGTFSWIATLTKQFRAPEDYLPLARAQELSFEPGTRQAYSNMGFVVLGAIIEEITGLTYHDAVQEMVFDPAG